MATTDELLDALMKDYKKPEDLIGENGLLKQLTKRLLERDMQAEMTEHLGYENRRRSSGPLGGFHPETVLFRPGGVNHRACLCGVHAYASAQSLDFLARTKNSSFPN